MTARYNVLEQMDKVDGSYPDASYVLDLASSQLSSKLGAFSRVWVGDEIAGLQSLISFFWTINFLFRIEISCD